MACSRAATVSTCSFPSRAIANGACWPSRYWAIQSSPADPDFATNVERVKRRAETDGRVAAVFRSLDAEVLTRKACRRRHRIRSGQRSGGPFAPPNLRRVTIETPGGPVSLPAPAAQHRGAARSYGAVPALGEHTDACGRSSCRRRVEPRGNLRRYALRCRPRRIAWTPWIRRPTHPILLADIGGTNSRFAFAGASGRPEHVVIIENDTVQSLETAIETYLGRTGVRPRAAVLAVAGPLDRGDEVALTNRAWRFRRSELARRFGFSQLRVINDFEAIAWSLPRARRGGRACARAGARAARRASRRCSGPAPASVLLRWCRPTVVGS